VLTYAYRVILGIGSVMLGPSAQSYTVEISHPAYRGTMVGVYNGCYFVGAIISTWLEYGIVDLDKVSTFNMTVLHVLSGLPERDQLAHSHGTSGFTLRHRARLRLVPARKSSLVDEPRSRE